MPLSDSIYNLGRRHGTKAVLGTAALGVGTLGAAHNWSSHSNDELEDRVGNTVAGGVRGTLVAGAGLGIGTMAVKKAARQAANSPKLSQPIGEFVSNSSVLKPFKQALNAPTIREALMGHAAVTGSLGAVIGGAIGSQMGDKDASSTAVGAGVGAVTGAAIKHAASAASLWKNIGPVGRVGAIIGATAAVAVGSKAILGQGEHQSEDIAKSDGMGSYTAQSNPTTVKSRLNTINATGDIVFGLNNKR